MFFNTCKSTLLTFFLETAVLQKRLVVYLPLTNLSFAAVSFLLIIETLIIILPTKTQTPQQSVQTIPTQNQQTKNVCADLFCIVLYCIVMK